VRLAAASQYARSQFEDAGGNFKLRFRDFGISYVTNGARAPAADNVILVLTAIGWQDVSGAIGEFLIKPAS